MTRPRPFAQQRAEAGDAVAAALDPARLDAAQGARENDEAVGWCAPTCSGIWRIPLVWRRALLLFGTVLMTVLAAGVFARGFFVGPADWVVALGGALLAALCLFGHFSWLLWMIGFIGWRGRPVDPESPDEPVTTRTALVMPIYHEDVDRVAAGIRQTWLSAERVGLAAHCDFYVLSDSVQPEIQQKEEDAVERLLPLFSGSQDASGRLFLVRRNERVDYKAGNIANFLRKHGSAYDFMLVLDADSVMLGARIRQLILKMQRHPRTAVLQSLMSIHRGATPFGQAMQFSVSRLGSHLQLWLQLVSGHRGALLGPQRDHPRRAVYGARAVADPARKTAAGRTRAEPGRA